MLPHLKLSVSSNAQLRALRRFEDDPFRAKWEVLYDGADARTVAFDRQGSYIAVSTYGGQVRQGAMRRAVKDAPLE